MAERRSVSTGTLAVISIGVGLAVLAMKLVAWQLTGSVALFSDALESLVNIATAVITLAAIRYSARPADDSHPFGHHKVEYFSVVIEGVLIVLAALAIFSAAWASFNNPQPLDDPAAGLAVNIAASVVNGVWAFVLIRQGRARRSPALAADGMHLFTDVLTSVGVVAGLVLVLLTGWLFLDSLLAAGIALHILWQGWRLIRQSVGGLMDEAAPPAMVDRIRQLISDNADGAIEAHDVRTRQAGRLTFIEFHLVVPGDMSVSDAHDICDRIEEALRDDMDDAHIAIHVEPEGKAKHTGVVVV